MMHGNDVAKFCLRFPSLLNFLEFQGFLDVLRILVLQVSLCRQSPENSGIPGLYLSRQVSLNRHRVEHPFAILENSTLRRDWNFVVILRQVSLSIQFCRLEALNITGLLDTIELFTDEELVETVTAWFIAVGLDFCHNPVIFFLFLHLFVIILVS